MGGVVGGLGWESVLEIVGEKTHIFTFSYTLLCCQNIKRCLALVLYKNMIFIFKKKINKFRSYRRAIKKNIPFSLSLAVDFLPSFFSCFFFFVE